MITSIKWDKSDVMRNKMWVLTIRNGKNKKKKEEMGLSDV